MRNWINLAAAVLLFIGGNVLFASFLSAGMRRTYGLSKDSELLILGHSHIMLALNAGVLERGLKVSVSKYTREGVTVAERKLMAEQYLAEHKAGKLRLVVYGVDPYLFNSAGLSENSCINFYPMFDDPVIAPYIRKNTTHGEYCKLLLLPLCRFHDAAVNAGISGWFRTGRGSFKTGRVDLGKVRYDIRQGKVRRITIQPESLRLFRKTIRLFTERGIRVILLNTPILDLYNALEPEAHVEVDAVFRDTARDPLAEYWDLNPIYEHDYELFRDPIHLNRGGQTRVSEFLAEKLRHEILAN